jgi:uncharacterized protein (UPF0147 family)
MSEDKIQQVITILQSIVEDRGIPRNIRRAASDAVKLLENKSYTPAVRAANALSILDECSQDTNMPLFARTKIWRAVTYLEQIRDLM